MARKATSKLYRNLKAGDKILLQTGFGIKDYRTHVLTVTRVQETRRAWFTGRRQWMVLGNYPWWFPGPILSYSDDRTELVVGE